MSVAGLTDPAPTEDDGAAITTKLEQKTQTKPKMERGPIKRIRTWRVRSEQNGAGGRTTRAAAQFRGRGPVSQRQVAALLAGFEIFPVVLHPTKRASLSRRGYRRSQFDDAFARFLPQQSGPEQSEQSNIRTPESERENN